MTDEAGAFLAEIDGWPAVRVTLDESVGIATVSSGSRTVARVDLHSNQVLVVMPDDAARRLMHSYPSARSQHDGLAFTLSDASSALHVLRRRVGVERFAPQFRDESP
jgi:hypothetical protein